MKISIVTVCRNAAATLTDTITSIQSQTYPDIEHILIDGGSTDGTQKIIEQHKHLFSHWVSEPDKGIYDAMNKGIDLCRGDVIGLLNADDMYEHEDVLKQVAQAHQDQELDACYADLVYVNQSKTDQVVRRWQSRPYQRGLSFKGWMPAHPTLFLKRRVYQQAGLFRTDLRYQSDLEFCTRIFEKHQISSLYIPQLWVRMRLGGVTNNSLKTMLAGNWESYLALRELGLKTNPITYFAVKFSGRLRQYF